MLVMVEEQQALVEVMVEDHRAHMHMRVVERCCLAGALIGRYDVIPAKAIEYIFR